MTFVITQHDPRDKVPCYFMYIQTIMGIGSGASWSFDPDDAARYSTRREALTGVRKIKTLYPDAPSDRYAVAIAPLSTDDPR
jgi:hypothetical protein